MIGAGVRQRRVDRGDVKRAASAGEDVVERELGLVVLDPLQPVAALEQRHQLAVAALEDADPADLAQPRAPTARR